jgi:molybdopterin biosynthesis enzyme MoaB
MAGKIFINYRRGDDPGFTQALYQRLENEFTADDLFMDVEGHIRPGDDFVKVLNDHVTAADVLLAVIGPRWTESLAARRNDPDDFVAIEIKAALENNKRVIPVLVGGADMPRADSLPEAIRPLARRDAVGLRPVSRDWSRQYDKQSVKSKPLAQLSGMLIAVRPTARKSFKPATMIIRSSSSAIPRTSRRHS